MLQALTAKDRAWCAFRIHLFSQREHCQNERQRRGSKHFWHSSGGGMANFCWTLMLLVKISIVTDFFVVMSLYTTLIDPDLGTPPPQKSRKASHGSTDGRRMAEIIRYVSTEIKGFICHIATIWSSFKEQLFFFAIGATVCLTSSPIT